MYVLLGFAASLSIAVIIVAKKFGDATKRFFAILSIICVLQFLTFERTKNTEKSGPPKGKKLKKSAFKKMKINEHTYTLLKTKKNQENGVDFR